MTKEIFLDKYIDIETNQFDKKVKQRLIKDLINTLKNSDILFTFNDIEYILGTLLKKELTVEREFFAIAYPIIKAEINLSNLHAIKLIIRLNPSLVISIDNKYSSVETIKRGLSIFPDDLSLLKLLESQIKKHTIESLHELPVGVLYNNNGATIEQCDELIQDIEEYKIICSKLNIDNTELITRTEFYYSSYRKYLLNKDNYEDFEHYLGVILNESIK